MFSPSFIRAIQVALLLPTTIVFASPVASNASVVQTRAAGGLADAAKAAGLRFFGASTTVDQLNDEPYAELLSNTSDFNLVTSLEQFVWGSIERQPGQYDFSVADRLIAFAERNGQLVAGGTLVDAVRHYRAPGYINPLPNKYPPDDIRVALEKFVTAVVSRYRGRVHYWDVARDVTFGRFFSVEWGVGVTDYLQIALRAARKADPNVKLYVSNAYLEEFTGRNVTDFPAMLNLVKRLQAENVPIDGVNFWLDLFALPSIPPEGDFYSNLVSKFRQLEELGVEGTLGSTSIWTEEDRPWNPPAAPLHAQVYRDVVRACKDSKACVGINLASLTDKYQILIDAGPINPYPWDKDLQKKEHIYNAIRDGLVG
ncbi:glycosyl hydrolase family 10 protein [Coprinopsis cinerea AmutBmut pab1-1]|nr:glycosyl hydrolase family 10 protein [Coprinopsis cinerea AmutBmut pab1-1]